METIRQHLPALQKMVPALTTYNNSKESKRKQLLRAVGPQVMALIVNDASGLPLHSLSTKELNTAVMDILSEISLVSGAPLHQPDLVKQQLKAISMFLWTGYGDLKKAEISFAFTLNYQDAYPEKYRHYNREINLEFMGDVLQAYREFKSQTLKKHYKQIYDILEPERDDLKSWEALIEADYQLLRSGELEIVIYPVEKYIALRKLGLLQLKDATHFLRWMNYTYEKKNKEYWNISKKTFSSVKSAVNDFSRYGIAEFRAFIKEVRFTIYYSFLKECMKRGYQNVQKIRGVAAP